MYEELIKKLRTHNGWALNETLDKAANVIEELITQNKVLRQNIIALMWETEEKKKDVMSYEKLVKQLREVIPCECPLTCKSIMNEAAYTIEELVAMVKADKELLEQYGGETGIKNLNEFAGKYWDALAKIPCWISVTEALPKKEKKRYWVCTNAGYQCECRWTNNRFGIGESDEWGWSIFDIPQYQNVVAWMPLPDPYKPKEET